MFLDATTRKIQALMASAATTTNPTYTVDWVDIVVATGGTPGATVGSLNGTTAVDIMPAPAASAYRKANGVSIYNADTVAQTITVRYNDNATLLIIIKTTLQPGQTLLYTDTGSWLVGATTVAPIIYQKITSGTTATISGPLLSDQVVLWLSATGGTKTTTIPTSTGSLKRVTNVDGQGTATPAAPVVFTPVAGSVTGTPLTDRIIDASGSLTLLDTPDGWVLAS